jgi:hypothetical protein
VRMTKFGLVMIAVVAGAFLFLAAIARGANWNAPQLDAAASAVAGRNITVWCETSERDWINHGNSVGVDYSFVQGYSFPLDPTSNTIYVSPLVCLTLHGILSQGAKAVGAYWGSLAIHTLVHEATHLALKSTDERLVDCTALKRDAAIAHSFFGWPTLDYSWKTVLVHNTAGRIIGTKQVQVKTPSTIMAAFKSYDQGWHQSAPAPQNGVC